MPIFFYVSQVIQTPDGLGTIVSVDKQKQIVSVYLPELNQTTKEYSTSTLYNFLIGNSLMSADVYQKQNLERKWNYQSLLNEIPLDIVTPFHQNIQNLTDEDIYTLIQPTSAQSLDHSSSNCKKAKKSKTNSTEDNLQTISTAPQMPRLSIPLITKAENPLMNQQAAILFMKPGTLPFFVESMSHDNEMKHSNSSLSLELLSQINSSSLYKHHLLPNPYDDSFFESLGFEPDSCSKFLSVNSSNEEELTKMHE